MASPCISGCKLTGAASFVTCSHRRLSKLLPSRHLRYNGATRNALHTLYTARALERVARPLHGSGCQSDGHYIKQRLKTCPANSRASPRPSCAYRPRLRESPGFETRSPLNAPDSVEFLQQTAFSRAQLTFSLGLLCLKAQDLILLPRLPRHAMVCSR